MLINFKNAEKMETTERVPNTGAACPAQPATNDRLAQKPRRCAQPNPGFDTSISDVQPAIDSGLDIEVKLNAFDGPTCSDKYRAKQA